ncbi:MAG: SEC-C metal-binding domain-containing protein [Solirubrobacterales bacterium]
MRKFRLRLLPATDRCASFGALDAPLTDTDREAARELIDSEMKELLGLAGPLDDPFELERLASTISGALADAAAPAGVPELMVESLENRQGPAGTIVLRAIAQLASGAPAAMTEAALTRLRGRGVEPSLPQGLGERELDQALLYALDGADLYLVRLRRPGDRRVQVGYLGIERRQTGGALDDGVLAEPVEEGEAEQLMYRGEDAGEAELRARPVSSEQLAHALGEASARTRELGMTVRPELATLLAILAPTLGIDPAALSHALACEASPLQVESEDEGRFEELSDRLVEDFLGWVEETHGTEGALWRSGAYVAGSMLQWKWGYVDGDLAHWTAADVEEFLVDFAPRKLDTDDELIADGPDCVAGFLAFLDAVELLVGDPLAALSSRCDELRGEFAEAARDPGNWGLAKSMVAQMQSEGIDPTDPGALQAWMEDFNSRTWEERHQVVGAAADRMAAEAGIEVPPDPDAPEGRPGLDLTRSGVAWAVGWFPPQDYEEARELWGELAELWGEIPHEEYCRRLEATLRGWARNGVRPALVDLRVADLIVFAEERQIDPGESRDLFAAEMLRRGNARSWPPGRNKPCWCGSGVKYKRCCGTVTAVATHPLDARV